MSAKKALPARVAGEPLSVKMLRKLGHYELTRQESLSEGDIVLKDGSSYCVVRKDSTARRGALIVLRELGTNTLHRMRFQPQSRISVLRLPEFVPGRLGNWRMASGDVVVYLGNRPHEHVAAIRSERGWHRTAAPWTPVSDAEILLDVREKKAVIVRCTTLRTGGDPSAPFTVGSMVASRNITPFEDPSVWVRKAPNLWVPNSRGAAVSDRMIRYEMRRGTYQVLRLPEVPQHDTNVGGAHR